MKNYIKCMFDVVTVKITVSKRLKTWCNKNHGGQATLSYAISSKGSVEFDLRDRLSVERMAIRLQNSVPDYLKKDVGALIVKIVKS